MGQISNSGLDYNTFIEQLFIPNYKAKVQTTTFEARLPVLKKLMTQFEKKKKILLQIFTLNFRKIA